LRRSHTRVGHDTHIERRGTLHATLPQGGVMFGSFSDIRADERRLTWTTFFVLFGVMTSHAILEAARDALFLSRLPPSRLPWVYMGVAFFSLLLYALRQTRGGQVRVAELSRLVCFGAVGSVLFWVALEHMDTRILYALYMWPAILATSVIVRFWTLTSNLFSVGQAKRLYTLLGVGGVLGAIFGSAMARAVLAVRQEQDLLLASAAVLLLTALGPVLLMPRPAARAVSPVPAVPAEPRIATLVQPLRQAMQRPYLRRVGAMIFVSTLAFTVVDYSFKSMVSEQVAPERLGEFFSMTYIILNSLSLFAQVFVVGWLVRVLGVNQVLGVLPVLLVLGTFGIILGGGLIAASILKGFDGMLRNSLHRTASEVLYVPLPGDLRNSV
jgi:ATP/ADP translocase